MEGGYCFCPQEFGIGNTSTRSAFARAIRYVSVFVLPGLKKLALGYKPRGGFSPWDMIHVPVQEQAERGATKSLGLLPILYVAPFPRYHIMRIRLCVRPLAPYT